MKLYNTLTRSIDSLQPLSGNTIKLYTCGLTVYSQPHIGNWTGYIYWDVLVRSLRAEGYCVERTQNITDVGHLVSDDDEGNDKMEVGAKREGMTAWDIANKYIAIADHEAYDLLGFVHPEHIVRATECIDEQIVFAKELEAKGYTYIIPDEGVYFDTSKLSEYGRLARLDIEGLQAGARVAVEGKRNHTDFAIWKFSPEGKQRDMEWDSPWGKGFPGWHLECSVIARKTLGDQIDIHTGGIDHIPVHHTNEIAQTEALTGKPFASFWMHNNHLKVDGGKMSKSLGTIYTLQDILDKGYGLDAFKLFVLGKQYRTEGNFTWEHLTAAQQRLNHWYQIAV
ncbi:MAG TPA: cysteine--tRNA ligase, partial [Candidatus Limnocylindrales bacterium]|nr:cysteine--tRNA ligase [Candidatus Limnocylindrales bacterium]